MNFHLYQPPPGPQWVERAALLPAAENTLGLRTDGLEIDSSLAHISGRPLGLVELLLEDAQQTGYPVVQPDVQYELQDLDYLELRIHDQRVFFLSRSGAFRQR